MSTIRTILEASALRALLHGTSREPATMTADERVAALAPLREGIAHDERALETLISRAQAEAMSRMRTVLHGAPGVDHEMLDQAIEHATSERGGWRPL